jgi:hypothetical protein
MSYTREQWSRALLTAIGNISPNSQIVNFVIGWTVAESTTNSRCMYNLLNTTQPLGGSVSCNSAHVQSYPSFAAGIAANAEVLNNGLYPDLLSALKNNYVNWLFPSPTNAIHGDLSMWVTGTRTANIDSYLTNILDEDFVARAQEQFQGNISMGLPTTAHDDGVSIHFDGSPFVITLGFRTLYNQLADQGLIPPDDVPLNNEYNASPVELSNPGYWAVPGRAQETRYFRFGWSSSAGAHRTFIGQEFIFRTNMLEKLLPLIEQMEQGIELFEKAGSIPELDEVISISNPTGAQEMITNTSGAVSSWSPQPTVTPAPDSATTTTQPTTI